MSQKMRKFVWDTSALLNIKEPDAQGYSPGNSLMTDFSDGSLEGPYQNIFPAIAFFELQASISRKLRERMRILREYYIIDDHAIVYPIDDVLVTKAYELSREPGFDRLKGADLIFACIAYLEGAYLVTLDGDFKHVTSQIDVINLNDSRSSPRYRQLFE